MTAVHWSPQAGDDLAAIFAYIAPDSEHYAWLTVRELVAATGRLREFPEIGRIVPELSRQDIRELIWRSYRVVYQYVPNQDEVRVLTVFRAERMFQVPQDLRWLLKNSQRRGITSGWTCPDAAGGRIPHWNQWDAPAGRPQIR